MRISDWSSDVCSSDLAFIAVGRQHDDLRIPALGQDKRQCRKAALARHFDVQHDNIDLMTRQIGHRVSGVGKLLAYFKPRSEEHTSELQSLMRLSYAFFCLNTTSSLVFHTPLILSL